MNEAKSEVPYIVILFIPCISDPRTMDTQVTNLNSII